MTQTIIPEIVSKARTPCGLPGKRELTLGRRQPKLAYHLRVFSRRPSMYTYDALELKTIIDFIGTSHAQSNCGQVLPSGSASLNFGASFNAGRIL